MSLYKHTVGLLAALRKPLAPGYAPICATCGRYLDAYEIVEGYPGSTTFARVLGKHHGSEELVTFDMGGVEWTHEDLASQMRSHIWFDPTLAAK